MYDIYKTSMGLEVKSMKREMRSIGRTRWGLLEDLVLAMSYFLSSMVVKYVCLFVYNSKDLYSFFGHFQESIKKKVECYINRMCLREKIR
jgi:hypothetical protein